MPIASGIGGGSADAAATLVALSRLWGLGLPSAETVLALGADVPVCLAQLPARMGGVEEFRARVLARLVLLPRNDPQFRRNQERVNRDAERERITIRTYPRRPDHEGVVPRGVGEAVLRGD